MSSSTSDPLRAIFPACSALLAETQWRESLALLDGEPTADRLAALLAPLASNRQLPPYLPELANLELALYRKRGTTWQPATVDRLIVNPTFELLRHSWRGLAELAGKPRAAPGLSPSPGEEYVMLWRAPADGRVMLRRAEAAHLLALKMVVDDADAEEIGRQHEAATGKIDAAIAAAVDLGILLRPQPAIRRDAGLHAGGATEAVRQEEFLTAEVFTLQWHITQACDLHCRHCYDRSSRSQPSLSRALEIIGQMRRFCRAKHIDGHISFTGGNPLLYPHFFTVYEAAARENFTLAILGNPVAATELDRLLAITRPGFYQLSLEGLEPHNDAIRGPGHFQRVLATLEILRGRKIYSMIMLTLTRDNLEQVLPLAEVLRDKTDLFTFNRLAAVGEGAALDSAAPAAYEEFLDRYLAAEATNPVMALKDNLFNIILHRQGKKPFGGCAGHGCGAAFNFVSLLPDGEVHACRKFPSPIGNINEQTLAEVYDAEAAERYRRGSAACRSCLIRPVCGGCPAVVHGLGLDPFRDRDPYCFME